MAIDYLSMIPFRETERGRETQSALAGEYVELIVLMGSRYNVLEEDSLLMMDGRV